MPKKVTVAALAERVEHLENVLRGKVKGRGMSDVLQRLEGELKATHEGVVALRTEMKNLAGDVSTISRILLEGNSQPPLTTQVSQARADIARLDGEMEGLRSGAQQNRRVRRQGAITGLWSLLAAASGGLIVVVGQAIAQALLH